MVYDLDEDTRIQRESRYLVGVWLASQANGLGGAQEDVHMLSVG